MKTITRDNWRVVAAFSPTKAPGFLAALGVTEQWGTPAHGHVSCTKDFEITVWPDGENYVQVGEMTYPRDNKGEKGCEVIREGLLRHSHVVSARIVCDEYSRCTHCGSQWEELWNNSEVAEFGRPDNLSVIGEPVCCVESVNEFRAERGIALLRST